MELPGIDRPLNEPTRSRAWQRTASGAATEAELQSAISELASMWSYNTSDHRLYDDFLISKGIDRRRTALSGTQEIQFREEFTNLAAMRVRATIDLIQGALKINADYILTRSRDFTQDLKHSCIRSRIAIP